MTDGDPARVTAGRAFAVYTALRFVVFVAVTGVLFGIAAAIVVATGHAVDWRSARPVLLASAFVALPVSFAASYFLLARQRKAMTAAVEAQVERYRAKVSERTAAEDAYAERLLAEQARDADGEPASGRSEP